MKPIRLGSIRFINSLPVDLGILTGEVPFDGEIIRDYPSSLNRALAAGEIDAGPVSSLHYAENASNLVLIDGFSISSHSGVQSVLLFSRRPIADLDGKRIALTPSGKSTPLLLKILLQQHWNVQPLYVPLDGPGFDLGNHEAALLIGDEALVAANVPHGYPFVYDLAEEWVAWTRLPFVFALWAVRKDFYRENPDGVKEIECALRMSREWGKRHMDRILDTAEQATGLSQKILSGYFDGLRYDFEDDLVSGFSRYVECARRLGALPSDSREEAGHARILG